MRGSYPPTSILAEPLAMTKKTNTVVAPRNSTRGETAIREFANSNLTLEQSKPRAAVLLDNKELLRNVPGLTPEEQTKFLDRVDQVRRSCLQKSQLTTLVKAYPTIDSLNIKFVTALGDVCSATERLPTSAVVSTGLEKRGTFAVASGGSTDIWRGEYNGAQVVIKAFRIYPAQNLREAKEVSIQSPLKVCSLTKFTVFVATGAGMEEAVP